MEKTNSNIKIFLYVYRHQCDYDMSWPCDCYTNHTFNIFLTVQYNFNIYINNLKMKSFVLSLYMCRNRWITMYLIKIVMVLINSRIRFSFRMNSTAIEEGLISNNSPCKDCSKINYVDFVRLLNIPANNAFSQQLFRIYDQVSDCISSKDYPYFYNCGQNIWYERYYLYILTC